MQVSPVLSLSPSFNFYSPTEFIEMSAKLSEDFGEKLKFDVTDFLSETPLYEESSKDEIPPQLHNEGLELEENEKEEEEEEDNDDDEDDYEFSFVCTDPDGESNLADDIFTNGQIRPIFPIFNRDLLFAGGDDGDSKSSTKASSSSSLRPPLRKLFVEERDAPSTSSETEDLDGVPTGTYCEWSGKAVLASPEVCKKSNSTGFSKIWRFRDLLHRSSSDGKDAFIFLNPATATSAKTNQKNENVERSEKIEKSVKVERSEVPKERSEVPKERRSSSSSSGEAKIVGGKVRGKGEVKGKTALSAHEKHYVRNRAAKVDDRRKSYLPYKVGVGFFTNVNGLSRNVHPF